MKNAPLSKNRISGIAAYIAAAVLLIVLTVIARKIDGAFFQSAEPFKPAEMTVEAIFIIITGIYAVKHRESGILKSIGKHVVFVVLPLIATFSAFFYIPDKILPASQNAVHIFDMFLSSFADDLVLCASGCILLIHKSGLKKSGVLIMLTSMALYEAVLTEERGAELAFAVFAVIITGYFEIRLHIGSGSALFCAVYHFLIHLCIKLPVLNTAQDAPYFGAASNVLYYAALLIMLISGVFLYAKRKK